MLNFPNPRSYALKKYIFDITQENYSKYEDIAERLGASLITEKDITQFMELLGEVYIKGYHSAIEQQKEQLEKLGVKVVSVNTTKKEITKIFQEKSG